MNYKVISKTTIKSSENKIHNTVFVKKNLTLLFPEGYEPFAEKNARAKSVVKNIKFPLI